jgi:hypothetical protein
MVFCGLFSEPPPLTGPSLWRGFYFYAVWAAPGVAAGLAFVVNLSMVVNRNSDLCIFPFGKYDLSCGERHMVQDHIPLQVFIFATVLLAAFFGSIAVALSWLG